MKIPAHWKPTLLLIAIAAGVTVSSAVAPSANSGAVAGTIKKDVAQIVAGINAHDPVRATAYDAPDIVSYECGSPSSVGAEADREGFKTGFAHDPLWKVTLINETVDVAGSQDFAVYRGTYNEDHGDAGVLMTHKTNFIAEFRRQTNGPWRMTWYSVSNMEPSHRK